MLFPPYLGSILLLLKNEVEGVYWSGVDSANVGNSNIALRAKPENFLFIIFETERQPGQ
jgi:hypothetical protein